MRFPGMKRINQFDISLVCLLVSSISIRFEVSLAISSNLILNLLMKNLNKCTEAKFEGHWVSVITIDANAVNICFL